MSANLLAGGCHLRIGIVTTNVVQGDAQSNILVDLVNIFKKYGCMVSVYTFGYKRNDDLDVHYLGKRNEHTLLSNIIALMNTNNLRNDLSFYDLIIAMGPDVGALPAIHLCGRKVLWDFHGMTPPRLLSSNRDKLLQVIRLLFYKISMCLADNIRVDSGFIAREISMPCCIIPIGVDIERFSSGDGRRIRKMYGIDNDDFLLLYTGRLVEYKNIDYIIRSMDKDQKLIIVGRGDDRKRLELVSNKYASGNVFFSGFVDDEELPDYYAACDAWITASKYEGFCVPIIEAMAAGKPVIVPMVGAMPDIVGDAGVVYSEGQLKYVLEHVKEYIVEANLVEKSLSRRFLFSKDRIGEMYMDLIEEINRGR